MSPQARNEVSEAKVDSLYQFRVLPPDALSGKHANTLLSYTQAIQTVQAQQVDMQRFAGSHVDAFRKMTIGDIKAVLLTAPLNQITSCGMVSVLRSPRKSDQHALEAKHPQPTQRSHIPSHTSAFFGGKTVEVSAEEMELAEVG